MKYLLKNAFFSTLMFLTGNALVWACTDVRLIAEDGTVLIARSMEFSLDVKSRLLTTQRGKEFKMTAPNGKPGMHWQAKYGYVFLDGLDLGVAIDGMNEQGLSFEALLFPNEAKYQTVPGGRETQALSYVHFGDWVLGNFQTVEEVRENLPQVYVFEEKLSVLNNAVFPLHFSIFDASGAGIVVEYVDGKLNVYDHVGVMTNSPSYDWHLTNLRNYIGLSPLNPKPVMDNGITYAATGQGAGMIGLPGDVSPPSRFVKMAVFTKVVLQPKDAMEALNMAQHMLNNVDIPLGLVRETETKETVTNELTQWVVFKDLKNKKLYYRTYDDMTIRAVDLNALDFSEEAKPLKMPIAAEPTILDMTAQFVAS